METGSYFQLLLESIDKIIEADKSCVDIIRWANESAITKYGVSQIETVSVFLSIGLIYQVSECRRGIKNYLRTITGMGGSYETEEQWELVGQRDELYDLEEAIPKILQTIVKSCNASEENYLKVLEENKKTVQPYNNISFQIQNIRRMKRYLDLIITFLNNLDEAKVENIERLKYTSHLFSMHAYLNGKQENKPKDLENRKDYYDKEDNFIHIMWRAGIVTYDGFDVKITDKFIPLMQQVLDNSEKEFFRLIANLPEDEFLQFFQDDKLQGNPQMKAFFLSLRSVPNEELEEFLSNLPSSSDEKILDFFIKNNFIDSDRQTITDKGLEYFFKNSIFGKDFDL